MSDDLKINLPTNLPVSVLAECSGTTDGAVVTSGKYEREARESTRLASRRQLDSLGGQNNLSVPAQPKPSVTSYGDSEARESAKPDLEKTLLSTEDSRGAQNSLANKQEWGGVKCDAPAEHSVTMHTETTAKSTGIIPIGSAASNVQSADAACPQSGIAPTLATAKQKQPSLRPSPISGVTPPIETRWKKGQSGNPGGRPKITREETAKWLEEKREDGKTNARKAIESVGEVAQSAGRHSAAALKTLHDILPDDKKDESNKGGVNIANFNMAILQQITKAATESSLE